MNHFQNITDDNRVKAGKGGAIEVILNVMRTHSKNGRVCEEGCLALYNITLNNGKQIEAQMKQNLFQITQLTTR